MNALNGLDRRAVRGAAATLTVGLTIGAVGLVVHQQFVWWAGLAVLVVGTVRLGLVLGDALADPVRLLVGVLAAVAAAAVGILVVDATPLGEPGWQIAGREHRVVGQVGDMLVLDTGGYELTSGERRWAASGRVEGVTDGVALVVTDASTIAGVEVKTGERLWNRGLDAVTLGAAPVEVAHDHTFVLTADGHERGGLAVDATTGETRWRVADGWLSADWPPYGRSTVAVHADHVVHGHGDPEDEPQQVLSVRSGAVVRKQVTLPDAFVIRGDTLVAIGRGDDGVRGIPLDGGRAWSWAIDGPVFSDFVGRWVVEPGDCTTAVDLLDLATGEQASIALPEGWTCDAGRDLDDRAWVRLRRGERHTVWNPRTGALVEVPDGALMVDATDEGVALVADHDDWIGRDGARVWWDDGTVRQEVRWTSAHRRFVRVADGAIVLHDDAGLRVVPLD